MKRLLACLLRHVIRRQRATTKQARVIDCRWTILAVVLLTPAIPLLTRLQRSAMSSSDAWGLVRSLTDEVGPRYPCTPGDVAGVEWARRAMRRAGLSHVRAEPAEAVLWERGAERGHIIVPTKQPVHLTALGGSVGTPAGGVEARVIGFPSLEALDKAPDDLVAGKIVYLHHVMPRLFDGTGYNAGGAIRMLGPARAARKGAVACLLRSIGTDTTRAPHTGTLAYEPGGAKIPAAALSTTDGDLLQRALLREGPVYFSLTLGCQPLPAGISHNVIGELPGTDKADEIVLLGAHLDSWDLGTGALDDGAGCAIALEAAHHIASLPSRPRRTIRVALFANEELGIGGGKAYAAAYAAEASAHVAALEADQGDGRPWALRVPEGQQKSELTSQLSEALRPLRVGLDRGVARGGVDIAPLRTLGVPFVDLRQDATRYFDFHHTANDVFENVSRTDIEAATVAFASAVWVIANADERFPTAL